MKRSPLRRRRPLDRTRFRRRTRKRRCRSSQDRAYLEWIHTLPCLVPDCEQCTPTEAHHFGPRAYTRKAPDRCALPLCGEHHRTGRDAIHVLGRQFGTYHGFDPAAEIRRLNEEYDAA